MNRIRALFVLLLCFTSLLLSAQIPSDLSNIKSSQISDNQLRQYIQQAKASGISMDRFEAELGRRGLAPEELTLLKARIARMDEGAIETESAPTMTDPTEQRRRT